MKIEAALKLEGYVLIEKLAEGGFADVYLVRRLADGLECVMKRLRGWKNPDVRRTHEQELKILRNHQGPGIVNLIEEIKCGETPALILEFCSGGNLEDHINRTSAMKSSNSLRVLQWVCQSLLPIHDSGGFHRDIKPANLLIGEGGTVKIGDFGLGKDPKLTEAMTYSPCGTYGYVAPEVWEGGAYTAQADIYSLGATLFHMVTGIRPTQEMDLADMLEQADLSPRMKAFVLLLTSPEPDRRPNLREIIHLSAELLIEEEKYEKEKEQKKQERLRREAQKRQKEARDAFLAVGGIFLFGLLLFALAKSR